MAISCNLTSGVRIQGCKPQSQGGLLALAGIQIAPFSSTTIVTQNSSDETATSISGVTFYKFDLPKGTCYFKSNPKGNDENGTLFYDGEVILVINKLTAAVRNQIKILGLSRVHIIATDGNSNSWLLGLTQGCDLSGDSEMGSGTKPDERNGAVLKFTCSELDPPVYVNSGAWTSTY